MLKDPRITSYINSNGGKEAFDPETQPAKYAELLDHIRSVLAQDQPELMEAIPNDAVESRARFYLDLPSTPADTFKYA